MTTPTLTCFILLLSISSAEADCLQWGRDQFGNRLCVADDLVNRNPIIPERGGVLSPHGVTISNAPQPKCADGWTLVADLSMHPMCARELRKPQ